MPTIKEERTVKKASVTKCIVCSFNHILKGSLTSPVKWFLPIILIIFLPNLVMINGLWALFGPDTAAEENTLTGATYIVIFGPLIETILIALFSPLYIRNGVPNTKIIIVSALAWGILHVFNSIYSFFPAFWAFYIFITIYATWYKKGIEKAFIYTLVLHICYNALILCLMLLGL